MAGGLVQCKAIADGMKIKTSADIQEDIEMFVWYINHVSDEG